MNIKTIIAVACSCILVVACSGPRYDGPANLLLICVDTARADSFLNSEIKDGFTPLLGQAQLYRNANSAAPWTIPSVASVITGLYPAQHGAGQFSDAVANLDKQLPGALNPGFETLAEILAEDDFKTAAFVAHPWFAANFGLEQGFSVVYRRKGWNKLATRFYQWLDKHQKKKRFFGYLHFMETHGWHLESKNKLRRKLASYSPETRQQLQNMATSPACEDPDSHMCLRHLVYNAANLEIRGGIAEILKELNSRDLLDQTLVVLYSDHGEEFWDHKSEQERKQSDPRGIYGFGHGQSLYQELLHVPLLAWHPDLDGAVHENPVSLIDVAPSILNWLGVQKSGQQLPGQLLPSAESDPAAPAAERVMFASGIAYGPNAIAAREGDIKAIMSMRESDFQYFDLGADPAEQHPVESDALTMRFDTLVGDYVELQAEHQLASPDIDSDLLEHLKSIGYLQGVENKKNPEDQKSSATPLNSPEVKNPELVE